MFDKKRLEAELVLQNISKAEFAKALGIDTSTLYKKMNGKSDWTLTEIRKTGEILGKDKINPIFFAEKVS
ncbi:MAG: DUF739 family protein [Clostridia bacterium]|nr:DUF739 family protein [Clostridia bacterium]